MWRCFLSLKQAHAKVWHTYDMQWRSKQKGTNKPCVHSLVSLWYFCDWSHAGQWRFCVPPGLVGISLTADWGEPVDITNQRDIEAAERYIQFYMGWFATPIFNGDYPQVMKDYVGTSRSTETIYMISESNVTSERWKTVSLDRAEPELSPPGRKSGQQGLGASRLPVFSPQEKSYIKGTCDFLGLGHFTTRYVTMKNYPSGLGDSYFSDRDLAELVDPQWPDPGSEWLYSVPWGFRRLLNFVKVQSTNKIQMRRFLLDIESRVVPINLSEGCSVVH